MDRDWHQVYYDEMYTANEILALIIDYYELDEDVAQALCLWYETHEGPRQELVKVTLMNHETLPAIQITDENGSARQLTIEDLNLSCFYPRGSLIEEDTTCNSQFMLQTMPMIGAEVRE